MLAIDNFNGQKFTITNSVRLDIVRLPSPQGNRAWKPSTRSGATSENQYMPFDTLVANAGRLKILTALAARQRQEFVQLREATELIDGNLACHARRLQSAGFIAIHKEFRAGKPITSFALTAVGRNALELHAQQLLQAIGPAVAAAPFSNPTDADHAEDEW